VPRALHIEEPPIGLQLPPPPVQKHPSNRVRHDRQRRTQPGGV